MAQQTIDIADLEVPQLLDVKRQLDQVSYCNCSCQPSHELNIFSGIRAFDVLFRTAEASTGQIQILRGECVSVDIIHLWHVMPSITLFVTRPYSYRPDRTVLVPLTNSLYVPGKISDKSNVIVDIGTGYFVKKVNPFAI
jgi:prefoldin alpha subunit